MAGWRAPPCPPPHQRFAISINYTLKVSDNNQGLLHLMLSIFAELYFALRNMHGSYTEPCRFFIAKL